MLEYPLASKLFESFSILRWNDRLCPIEFFQIDHCALRSVVSFFLGKSLEVEGRTVDWIKIVDGNVFELMYKISTSDIQATVRSKIKEKREAMIALNNMVLFDWNKPSIKLQANIKDKLTSYINTPQSGLESEILCFAHKYATNAEFKIIKKFNNDFDMEGISNAIVAEYTNISRSLNSSGSRIAMRICNSDDNERLNKVLQL